MVRRVYTFWPIDSMPGALSPTQSYAARVDAEEARSTHVAMNPSMSLSIAQYAILSREVGRWEVVDDE